MEEAKEGKIIEETLCPDLGKYCTHWKNNACMMKPTEPDCVVINDKSKPCSWQGAKDNSPPQRGSILDEAKAIINGGRNDMYGNPEDSFMLIAELWSALLGIMISAKDVALMMCLLKIARETKQGSRDNWRDLAGYAALGADMEGKND